MKNDYSNSIDVASLISARICHDLISPIGAINNGLELLGLSGIPQGPEYDLIASSAENASARINFFRIAFGPCEGSEMSESAIIEILTEAYSHHRCSVNWNVSGVQFRSNVKLCFLIAQCLESALISGGEITVTKSHDNWYFVAQGDRTARRSESWDHLTGESCDEHIKPAEVHFELARQALDKLEFNLESIFSDSKIEIKVTKQAQI